MPPNKHLTYWLPNSGKGSIQTPGTAFFVDNASHFLVDNAGNFLVTTPAYVMAPNLATWTETVAS